MCITTTYKLFFLVVLAILTRPLSSFGANPPIEKCHEDGDTVIIKGRTSPGLVASHMTPVEPLCIRDPKSAKPASVRSLELVGSKLPPDADMEVTGQLRRSSLRVGYEIDVVSARDANADAMANYKVAHGSDAYSSCLQWQRDEKSSISAKSNSGKVSAVYTPRCGLTAVHASTGALVQTWMPEPGEGTARAKNIIDSAIARRANPTEKYEECGDWQSVVLRELEKANYPAYPNVTMRYTSPRCGVRLSNNETLEHVYLWLPENLAPALTTYRPEQLCSLKKDSSGQLAYASTPCIFAASSPSLQGSAITSIKSVPSGAALIMDGVVVAQTPALLVLQKRGDRSRTFTITVRKDGYREGSIGVKDGDVLSVRLSPE
jgi:hypothetical protein